MEDKPGSGARGYARLTLAHTFLGKSKHSHAKLSVSGKGRWDL